MKQYRVTKAIPGRLVGNRFVASRKNPDFTETPLGKLGLGVISLGTPAGLTKSGKLRKNPKENGTKRRGNPFDFRLQKQAQAADDRFQAALEKEYGKRAGNMRYQSEWKFPPHIRKLAKAKKAADEASHQYTVKYRKENPNAGAVQEEKKKGGGSNNSGDTSTDVRSPTSTSTEVRSPTKTETRAQTQGNFTATVTGGAGDGANTTVTIKPNGTKRRGNPFQELPRDKWIPAMVRIIGDGTFELVLEAV